jgi:hypothetical protein
MTSTAPTGDGALGPRRSVPQITCRPGHDQSPRRMAGCECRAGVDVAVAWAWRALLLAAAHYVAGLLIATLALVMLPVVIALMVAALLMPVVHLLMPSCSATYRGAVLARRCGGRSVPTTDLGRSADRGWSRRPGRSGCRRPRQDSGVAAGRWMRTRLRSTRSSSSLRMPWPPRATRCWQRRARSRRPSAMSCGRIPPCSRPTSFLPTARGSGPGPCGLPAHRTCPGRLHRTHCVALLDRVRARRS